MKKRVNLIVSWSLGPAAAYLLLLFFSYRTQKVKRAGRIYEFTLQKRKIGLRTEVIATFLSFSFFIVVALVCTAITRDEINNATHEQLANSNQNMSIIQALVATTRNIMETLEQQNRMNEELLDAISKMERSVEQVTSIGKTQDGYFRGLRIHFENFPEYFALTKDRLDSLEQILNAVHLLEDTEIDIHN